MPDPYSIKVEPFFLESAEGPLFAVHHAPSNPATIRGHVLCVPGFNEELNRCRSMVTLQAQALARIGYGLLVIDLFGTGDSAGEYRDARWDIWLRDVQAGMEWLANQPSGCSGLIGIRLGAILASEALRATARNDIALMLWQPIPRGKVYLTQFMRMRIAAQMDRVDVPKETTDGMRLLWSQGQNVEIAGYEIHPDLARAIDAAELQPMSPARGTSTLLLEQNASGDDQPTSPTAKLSQYWRDQGVLVDHLRFDGPPFWQLHERTLTPNAIELTTRWASTKLSAA